MPNILNMILPAIKEKNVNVTKQAHYTIIQWLKEYHK